jgi:hypothetical protein
MEFAPGDLLAGFGEHRIGLERAGAALARKPDRRARQAVAHPLAAEAGAHEDAGDRPDPRVGLVFRAAHPGDPVDAEQAGIIGARLDGAPAGRLAVEKSDEAAGRPGIGIAAACLPAQPLGPDFWGVVLERLARRQLVALTKTPRRLAALTENGLEIRPARLVGRADR